MTDHFTRADTMLTGVAAPPQMRYNGASNKANGAGVQPPCAALTLTGGTSA